MSSSRAWSASPAMARSPGASTANRQMTPIAFITFPRGSVDPDLLVQEDRGVAGREVRDPVRRLVVARAARVLDRTHRGADAAADDPGAAGSGGREGGVERRLEVPVIETVDRAPLRARQGEAAAEEGQVSADAMGLLVEDGADQRRL